MWLVLFAVLVAYAYFRIQKHFHYWQDKNVPFISSGSFLQLFLKPESQKAAIDLYNKCGTNRYIGIFVRFKPVLLIRDCELIKTVTIKSYTHFADHKEFASKDADPIWARNLFALKAKNGWQQKRSIMSPAFSSSKLKAMHTLMRQSTEAFTDHLRERNEQFSVNVKDAFSRLSLDILALALYGAVCNSLKDPENEFYLMGKKITNISILKLVGFSFVPSLMKWFGMRIFDEEPVEMFRNYINTTLTVREENGIIRPDVIHLLNQARNKQSKDNSISLQNIADITNDDIVGLTISLLIAGFDSGANALSYLFYELAINPHVQDKLYNEIKTTPRDDSGRITYETLMEMNYLDMVISESFRKWPGVWLLDRVCTEPFIIEPELPSENPLQLNVGDLCAIPVLAIHRNPNYYPNPEIFDPERFSDENKANLKPNTYFPFGAGPRICLGSRFAIITNKVVAAQILEYFEFVAVEETEIPIKVRDNGFNNFPPQGIVLGLKPRN